ncbi:uncharacterized protein LOC131215160 [Anopheles bellator]|uniref:uncharacterized protein LOC131215160 n=1 Tax=Anopheles bellator TaxID=139047 RepID=UPI002649B373|nr:uncharacterized protein LOC131215160 [Anopheles bellator]
MKCIVCSNDSRKTNSETSDQHRVSYHKFPVPGEHFDGWLKFCGIEQHQHKQRHYICSNHFTEHCFEVRLYTELTGSSKRRILKKDAVPTIRNESDKALDKGAVRKRKEMVEKLLGGEIPVTEDIVSPLRPSAWCENKLVKVTKERNCLLERIETLKQKLSEQRDTISALTRTNEQQTERIEFTKKELVNLAISLQEVKDHDSNEVTKRVEQILAGHFTEGQVAAILTGSGPLIAGAVRWTDDDLLKALELRCISAEAFDYVLNQLNYPFPAPLQIAQWIQSAYLATGVNATAFRLLKAYAPLLHNPADRICSLNFVKVDVPVRYSYDRVRDQIVGPNAQLHCLYVQGIFSQWKQIVHVDFDLVYSVKLVERVAEMVHEAGYRIAAITMPCDRETADMWNELGVSFQKHYIRHPLTDDPIYIFACPDTILTTMHRVLLDGGFAIAENNVTLTKEALVKLLESYDRRIHDHIKFNESHLDTEILNDAFNTLPSRVLISHGTANALKVLAESGDDTFASIATLFDLFSDWYELCTTVSPHEEHVPITRLPYGACEDEQQIVLDGMENVMESMRCVGSANYHYLPEAVLVSIASTRKLWADLRVHCPPETNGIPMQHLSSTPMSETLLSLQSAITVASETRILSTDDALFQLCRTVASVKHASHISNTLLLVVQLSADVSATTGRPDDPSDPDVYGVTEQEACEFLTHLIADRLRRIHEYLGERSYAIELQNDQYVFIPVSGEVSKVTPSKLWTAQAKLLEVAVVEAVYHRKASLVNGLVDSISKRHPMIGRDLIEMYVTKRIAIKLQCLNAELDALGTSDVTWITL